MMTVRREDVDKFHDPEAAQAEADRVKRANDLAETMLAAASESAVGQRRWYVLEVRKNTEQDVIDALIGEKICAWLPMRTIECKGFKKRKPYKKSVPVCPGYVFVRIVPDNHAFGAFQFIKSALGLISTGDRPTPVADEIIKAFKMLVERNIFDDDPRDAMGNRITEGDLVALHIDAREFVTGVIDGFRGTRHVRLRVALFGGSATMTRRLDEIEKIG
ncbi:transcription termination/antitermination protein NusG [Hoeflea sp. TYP-13]|uniref:transcription termination/antitermination protein NusG n=1 Tax=Hoeflea sp. TYP-13 TaxID=3230023 RepID=UPI0034C692FF